MKNLIVGVEKINPITAVINLLILALMIFILVDLHKVKKAVGKKLEIKHASLQSQLVDLKTTNEALLKAQMAEKVENIVKGLTRDEDKVIAVAQWVSGNVSSKVQYGNNVYTWFAGRTGLCGVRAALFVEMLSFLNIPAHIYNMYNFPAPGTGHSCAQAYYDDSWHFFDVTYAGYFKKEKHILSFDELIEEAKIGDPLEHLVLLEPTIDRYGMVAGFEVGAKAKNSERMRLTFFKDALLNSKSHGALRLTNKNLYIEIDGKKIPEGFYNLGLTGGTYLDVEKDAAEKKLSQSMGLMSYYFDKISFVWDFKNLDVGCTYSIKYFIYDHSYGDIRFWAEGQNMELTQGRQYEPGSKIWEIKFVAKSPTASLTIDHDKDDIKGAMGINRIEVSRETDPGGIIVPTRH
jgi:hypothetical protein